VTAKGGADLLVAGELAYAAPIVAEKTGIPWASYVLAPFSFFSAYDPPVLPPYPLLAKVQAVVPGTGQVVARFARFVTRKWPEPVFALRKDLGLPRGEDPIFDAKHSKRLVLALFSKVLGEKQKDWPRQTRTTGFVFYDGDGDVRDLAPELKAFLEAGPSPIVFTLGSAAVLDAGSFYEESAKLAEELGQRAVLLVGHEPGNYPKRKLPESIFVAEYAPYSKILPHASVVVHQGGVGTTAQTLRAGKPMLVMPYSHDQPDNARRVKRLGVAEVIGRPKYNAKTALRPLKTLLENPEYARRAAEIAKQIEADHGVETAVSALEEVFGK
jgi:UDP:flavonoid glycosyltransferase YjiC (YdhE family)